MPLKSMDSPIIQRTLRARILALRADSPAQWGVMTSGSMLCHLADTLRATLGGRKVEARGGWFSRHLLKYLLLTVLPFPRGRVQSPPELDPIRGGTSPTDFEADRAALLALLDSYAGEDPSINWPAHPILGPLSGAQWGRFHYLHFDHHLRQFGV